MKDQSRKMERRKERRLQRWQEERRLSLPPSMEGAAILQELHPVAAGVFNTAVFVIIPHRDRGTSVKFMD